ncbi:MAG: leucine-rich repeat domain-containing protein [Clostridia bacterium]|nr:leucine-rich repeat domain-containing protein [Clostridia bacterium]
MAIDFSALDRYALEKVSELTALADAIRAKTGDTGTLTVPLMTEAVNLIEVGGGGVSGNIGIIDYLEYAEYEDGYEVTGLKDGFEVTDIVIPSTYNGKPVIRIDDLAFGDYTPPEYGGNTANIKSVIISNSVREIGDYAFGNCSSLTTVVFIGNSVTDIGEAAFMYCSISGGLILPDSITRIEYMAFQEILITEIVIPDSVDYVGDAMLFACPNLKTVTFKGTPTTIDCQYDGVFTYCSNLTDIYVPWSEGEVANAPWGADNATIHYNSEV